MNEVYETIMFSRLLESLENQEKIWIEKIKDQLNISLKIGKPLRFDWFREKKFGNERFYLINTDARKVVIVSFGPKKDQQKIIDNILINKERYLELIS